MRAVLYLRVSTARQAEKDLSIPDQRRQSQEFCKSKSWLIVREYVEPGASATDEKRPAFQKMIEDGCGKPRPFDVVVVHSLSRFFRDAVKSGWYERKLEKNGVRLVSITQDVGDGPTGRMIKHIISAVDEWTSAEIGKHTLRSMKENARQGFWNGSKPPYGYKVVEAGKRADKIKKRLEIEPQEARIVRQIFGLYLHGSGNGPMGLQTVTEHLNEQGILFRNGRQFSKGLVYRLLTRPTYNGKHYFNRTEFKTGKPKPPKEWIEVKVPSLVDAEVFADTQRMLKEHNPRKTPPRIVSGPTLLSRFARCGICGGAMSVRTGKDSSRYRYYACSNRLRKGRFVCKGHTIPVDVLNEIVLGRFEERILAPDRLKTILEELLANDVRIDERALKLKDLRKELREAEASLNRLYELVEKGITNLDDTLTGRITAKRQHREHILAEIGLAERQQFLPRKALAEKHIRAASKVISNKLRTSDMRFARQYLALFIDRVDVDDDEIRIMGSKAALADAVLKGQQRKGEVRSFGREWRPQRESNPCSRLERAMS